MVEDFWVSPFRAELTYTGVIVFVKFSILALYWRIFSKSVSIKLPIITMSVLVFLWGVAVVSLQQQPGPPEMLLILELESRTYTDEFI